MTTDPATRAAGDGVFATAQFPLERLADHVGHGHDELVHAKTMGTMSTLCGLSTFSWHKFWDLPFASVLADRCPSCVRATLDGAVG